MTNQKKNLKRKKKSKQEPTVWNITESATDHLSIFLDIPEFLKILKGEQKVVQCWGLNSALFYKEKIYFITEWHI